MKTSFICYLSLLLLCTCLILEAQNPVPVYRNLGYKRVPDAIVFYGDDGKESFRIPTGHDMVTNYPNSRYSGNLIDDGSYQSMDPFFNDICVAYTRRGRSHIYYWIDSQGNTVKHFGEKYVKMSRFINGYATAWKKAPSGSGNYLLYLNKEGENAFGDKEFWEAVPFSEGMAAVMPEKGGDWGWIDETGEMVLKPKGIDQKQIVRLFSFSDGLAQVILKDSTDKWSYHFLDKQGELVLNVNDVFPHKEVDNLRAFYEGFLSVAFHRPKGAFRDVYMINKKGEIVHKFEKVEGYSHLIDDLFYIKTGIPVNRYEYRLEVDFYNAKGDTVKLNIPDSVRVINVHDFGPDLMRLVLSNKLDAIYSRKKAAIVATTKRNIAGFTQKQILVDDGFGEFFQVIDFDGNVVWETPARQREFSSIKEALKYKDEVRQFTSYKASDFENGLLELKNLEELVIVSKDHQTIPASILQLTNLKKLRLSHLPNIKRIPPELARLPKLQHFRMSNCEAYESGLEYVIQNSPSLRHVDLGKTKVPEGFVDRMKRLKPNLTIEVEVPRDRKKEGIIMESFDMIEMEIESDH